MPAETFARMHRFLGLNREAGLGFVSKSTTGQWPSQLSGPLSSKIPAMRPSRLNPNSMRDHPDIPLENRRSIGMLQESQ
jgi:hypothetical protein